MNDARAPDGFGRVDAALLDALRAVVGERRVVTDERVLKVMSKDHYWFSPVLKPELDPKRADAIVIPASRAQLREVVALAARARVPVTPRGTGTGNYGQGVPMRGGLVLSTQDLKEVLELTPDAARVEAGVRLGALERRARALGAELRMYPSTLDTATAGGFLAGGAGGIGSVTWGTLWDEGNVLAATVVTAEETPRLLERVGPEALAGVIHSCGLTGVIVDLTLALAPARPWREAAVAFEDFGAALRFGERLAYDADVEKRLVSIHEWPIPSFFGRLEREGVTREGRALALLELTLPPADLEPIARAFGGRITWTAPPEAYGAGGLRLSDFSWNHTTLWAIKADEGITYLQDAYERERVDEQIAARRARFGSELLHHVEFMRFGGPVYPQGMTLVRYRGEDRLREIAAFSEEIGMTLADPHTHHLDEDSRWNGQPILDARRAWNPHGLLNPGHLRAEEEA